MTRSIHLVALTLLATPLLVSGERRGTEITFNVDPGASITKSYAIKTEMILDDYEVTVDGQDVANDMDWTIMSDVNYEIEDSYTKVGDGRPLAYTRTFNSLSDDTEMVMEFDIGGVLQSNDMPFESGSVLEGESVEFVWNKEEEAYDTVLPEDSDLDEEDVEDLLEDMDFRAILPPDEVDEGDEWEIDMMNMQRIFAPGGNMGLIQEFVGDGENAFGGEGDADGLYDMFNNDIEGEFIAVFDGIRKSGDGEVAVITFTFELSNSIDQTDKQREAMESADPVDGAPEIELKHMDLVITYEGEGELTWDLEAGHFRSFEASGDLTTEMDMGMLMEAMGQEMDLDQRFEFSGDHTYAVSAE